MSGELSTAFGGKRKVGLANGLLGLTVGLGVGEGVRIPGGGLVDGLGVGERVAVVVDDTERALGGRRG